MLDRVADIVERQSDPYRPHRGQLDADLPLESRIIKAVNAYDDLVGASLESDRKLQALERLALGTDREFDPPWSTPSSTSSSGEHLQLHRP